MTEEQAERLSERLSNLNSLRAVYEVVRDLQQYEMTETDALAFQVPRLVLQDFAWRLEGLRIDPDDLLGIWAAVARELAPHIRDIVEAQRTRDEVGSFNALKRLGGAWAVLQDRLR